MRLSLSLGYLGGLVVYLALRWLLGDGVWWLSLVNTFALYLLVPLPLAVAGLLWEDRRWSRLSAGFITGLAVLGLGLHLSPVRLGRAAPPANASALSLSVLSYNMRADPAGLEAYLRSEDADLVFIQENAEAYANAGLEALSDLYPYQVSQEAAWGNMLLSKRPVLESQDLMGFGSSLPQRVVVSVEGKPVALYNVHLTWPIGAPRLSVRLPFNLEAWTRYDASARDAQLARLEAVLREESFPFLVVGDFNLSATSPTYERLRRVWQDAFAEVGWGFGHSWPTVLDRGGLDVPALLRLDYVWYSPEFRALEAGLGPALASDHLPVKATLRLTN